MQPYFTSDKSLKMLFIGNSATYVHDIPANLCALADRAGYSLCASSVVKGGYELSKHADKDTEHGQNVLNEIAKGYDVVFLQDNGNCVSTAEKREASKKACKTLADAILDSSAKVYIYVRPPYGISKAGRTPFEQCVEFDKLFGEIASEISATNVYVNRAFAYAIKNTDIELWGPDNAHTSEYGAYLAECVFFSTLFGISSSVLDSNGLSEETTKLLQSIADKVVIDKVIPW